jgi:hypothetical protein
LGRKTNGHKCNYQVANKKATYKGVGIFTGNDGNEIQDIFSIQPASSKIGVGVEVKL